MKTKKKKRKRIWFASLRKFLPLLAVHIQIPLFEIRTSVMYDVLQYSIFEYINLYIRFWKWDISFSLYITKARVVDNGWDC